MPITKHFAEDAVAELIEGGKVVDTQPWRHGHRSTVVFEYDGALWRVTFNVQVDDGWQISGGLTATQVKPVVKPVTVYEAVEQPLTPSQPPG